MAAFRGIPFAAPPTGADRFAAHRPVVPWDGVRDVSRFGSPPPQPNRPWTGDDWLTLAVWTPDPGAGGLPVVAWICGGAYLGCGTANPHHNGATLAAGGVVVVSANYRTGAEGFAHLGGVPDNRGLLDQAAALRWIQDNVAEFGGDPGNVTVFGESAGAGSVAALLVMPSAAGLFHRAIVQSLPVTYFTPRLAADIAGDVVAELGRPATAATPEDLVSAARVVTGRLPRSADRWGAIAHTPTPFSPVVDGEILPSAPWSALADGVASGVDLIVGHTRDEFRLLTARLGDITDDQVDDLIDNLVPGHADRYRAAFPRATAAELREVALSDWLMRMSTIHLAEAAHAGGARVWTYELCWGFGPQGASHALDSLLVFGTADIDGEITAAGPTAVDQGNRLSELMRTEITAFAAVGDPGWDRYEPRGRSTRVYDAPSSVQPYPEEKSRRIWRDWRFGLTDLPG